MKNSPFLILACACLVLGAFLAGMFVGHNLSGEAIQTSVRSGLSSSPDTQTGSGTTSPPETAPANQRININTADIYTLMQLEGIGPELAQRIIDYRNAHGPFKDSTELKNVEGIGQKRFDDIKYQITTGG